MAIVINPTNINTALESVFKKRISNIHIVFKGIK